jgi:hypothetical protein
MQSLAKVPRVSEAGQVSSAAESRDEAAEEERLRRLIAYWVERMAWRRALRQRLPD